jgi:proteic killer suppression protein
VIKSFGSGETRKVFDNQPSKPFARIYRVARRKLILLDSVERLSDLTVPPGNRLEALKGDRQGQYSIRINDQYRICFVWREEDAYDVEIVDYH